jgi:two-component system, OmpR family, response regulator QseB
MLAMRLLLVEDDKMLGESVQIGLQLDGYAVDWVRDGESARQAVLTHDYAAMLLDLGLPDRDGLDVLRSLRARGNATAVLIVTARDNVGQRIAGLDAGGDDYILKPFDLDELSARVRAVTRRRHGHADVKLVVGDVVIDTAARRASLDGLAVELTAREYTIAAYLMERAGRVVTRSELEEALYEWNREVSSNAVEVFISQLRRKLGRNFISTRRGFGYCVERP